MKDENGIDIDCSNCAANAQRDCNLGNAERGKVGSNGCLGYFYPSYKAYEARIAELQNTLAETEKKLTETVKLLSETSRECGKLEAEVKVLKAFVIKVHTSPVIFEDVNRALRDEAKTLLEKLNQSAESEEK